MQGSVPFLRQGEMASEVGSTFRLPWEFDRFVHYVGSSKIFFNPETKKWEYRNFHKDVGHFEVGYGVEPFQAWIDRQVARLVAGNVMP